MNMILSVFGGYCLWRFFNGYGFINFISAVLFIMAAFIE